MLKTDIQGVQFLKHNVLHPVSLSARNSFVNKTFKINKIEFQKGMLLEFMFIKINQSPHSLFVQYNLQADMTRRQLEYEVSRLSDLMSGNLGTSEQIAQRHEARLQRIRLIESEMLRMQQRHHDQVGPARPSSAHV